VPVHDMTTSANSIVGQPATGSHARCPTCGYGTVQPRPGAPAFIVHAASCPQDGGIRGRHVACDNRECRKVLDPMRVASNGAKTCDDRCRAAAWKARHNYGRHDAQAVSGRANGSQARRKPSGVQVSYRKAVAVLAAEVYENSDGFLSRERAARHAEHLLRLALSERQRKQLEDRESERGTNA
jgi:hypothetical protein